MVTRRRGVLLCGQARTTLAAIARELTRAGMPLVIQAAPEELKAARGFTVARRGRHRATS